MDDLAWGVVLAAVVVLALGALLAPLIAVGATRARRAERERS